MKNVRHFVRITGLVLALVFAVSAPASAATFNPQEVGMIIENFVVDTDATVIGLLDQKAGNTHGATTFTYRSSMIGPHAKARILVGSNGPDHSSIAKAQATRPATHADLSERTIDQVDVGHDIARGLRDVEQRILLIQHHVFGHGAEIPLGEHLAADDVDKPDAMRSLFGNEGPTIA